MPAIPATPAAKWQAGTYQDRPTLAGGKSDNVGEGSSLLIDIGGFTTDSMAVDPGGVVDYGLARSISIGIQQVITDFEESFTASNLELV